MSEDPIARIIAHFPDAFDERQRPVCGVWDPMLGPCVCGNPEGHTTATPNLSTPEGEP
jgi:hypothetical protein